MDYIVICSIFLKRYEFLNVRTKAEMFIFMHTKNRCWLFSFFCWRDTAASSHSRRSGSTEADKI